MKPTLWFATCILAASFSSTPLAMAATASAETFRPVIQHYDARGELVQVAQKRKGKSRKPYSKATLSALQPQKTKAKPTEPLPMGAQAKPDEPLLQPSQTQRVEINAVDQSFLSDGYTGSPDDSAVFEKSSVVGDSNVLGEESVSVIDRVADKPKAKPLSRGPLRMRMQDKGVRASVQIPLGVP